MRMDVRAMSVNAMWALIAQVFSRGSIIIASILLAHELESHDFNAFGYFNLTITMIATYSSLGLGVSASRFFSEIDKPPSAPQTRIVIAFITLSAILSTIALTGVLTAPTSWISAGLDVPSGLLALGVMSITLQTVLNGAIIGLEKYRASAITSIVSSGVLIGGAAVAAYLHSPHLAMSCYIAAAFLQVAMQAVVIGKYIGYESLRTNFRIEWAQLYRIMTLSGPMFITAILANSGAWIVSRILLRQEDAEQQFALFTIGLQWFALALLIPGIVSSTFLPRMVRILRSGASHDALRPLIWAGLRVAFGSALLVALASFAATPILSMLYGGNYGVSHSLMAAFLGAGVLSAPVNTMGNAIIATEGQWLWLWLTAIWLGALVLVALFLTSFGAVGAALSYSTAYILLNGLAANAARRRELI